MKRLSEITIVRRAGTRNAIIAALVLVGALAALGLYLSGTGKTPSV